jgi:hypothetical protein
VRPYEIAARWEGSRGARFTVSLARARVDKKEGSLEVRRPGDFDMRRSFRVSFVYPFGGNTTLAVAWQDRDGRPFPCSTPGSSSRTPR